MCKEIILIEEVVDLQRTYSILDLELSDLITDIVQLCRKHRFNNLDMRVLLHSLRDVPFRNEHKALNLCSELIKCIRRKSFSYFLKKIRQLKDLIQGEYKINGSMTVYNDKEIRWDTTVSYILNQALVKILRK